MASAGVGVAMGTMSAALFSVFALLTGGGDLAPGIVGCFLGMLIFVATPMGRPMVEGVDIWRSTKQFSYQQRREIARAVRQGRTVNDPVLAQAAARRALNLATRCRSNGHGCSWRVWFSFPSQGFYRAVLAVSS